jgi:hypothetical protein
MNAQVKSLFWIALFCLSPFIADLEARTLVFTYKSPEADSLFPSTYHNTQIEFKVARRSGEFVQTFATQADQALTLTVTDQGPDLLNPYTVSVYVQTIKPRSPPLPSFINTPAVGLVSVQEDDGERNRIVMIINPINIDLPGPLALGLFIF